MAMACMTTMHSYSDANCAAATSSARISMIMDTAVLVVSIFVQLILL